MQFILDHQSDDIDFDRYVSYLKTVKASMPPHVYEFASNSSYFDLSSPSSLHDSWLEELRVQELASGERQEVRRVQIDLRLLGPFHDRYIHLRYEGVTSYRWGMPTSMEARCGDIAHGDLYTHEIRVGANGILTHEISFERGATLVVECQNIRHWETLLEEGRTELSDFLQA